MQSLLEATEALQKVLGIDAVGNEMSARRGDPCAPVRVLVEQLRSSDHAPERRSIAVRYLYLAATGHTCERLQQLRVFSSTSLPPLKRAERDQDVPLAIRVTAMVARAEALRALGSTVDADRLLLSAQRCARAAKAADQQAHVTIVMQRVNGSIVYNKGLAGQLLADAGKFIDSVHAKEAQWRSEISHWPQMCEEHSAHPDKHLGALSKLMAARGRQPGTSCDVCGVSAQKQELFKCTKCRAAWYCSRACQRSDWKAKHRALCEEHNAPIKEGDLVTWRIDTPDLEPVGIVVSNNEQKGAGWWTVRQLAPFEAENRIMEAQHLSRDPRMTSVSFQDRELIAYYKTAS